jgi:Sortase domain
MVIGGRALLAALALGIATVPGGSATARPAGSRAHPAGAPVDAPLAAGFHSSRTFDLVAEPVRLRIPAVQVDTPLVRLGRQPDGTIAIPPSPNIAGWYAQGPRPGQAGPAVIVGHVDSTSGPGVFFRLYQLPAGATVDVERADGTTAVFRIVGMSRVPKTSFPTDLVYSPTLQPSLQLVTCGGSFDYRARSYRDNVIVYTVPA